MKQCRAVQWTTDGAAAVCGQEARDGYIRAKQQEREDMAVFTTKSHMLATFNKAAGKG